MGNKDPFMQATKTCLMADDDGFTMVRGKQSSKRQRISSSGQSGQADQVPDGEDLFESDFSDLSTDQKLSLILSKLSVITRIGLAPYKIN